MQQPLLKSTTAYSALPETLGQQGWAICDGFLSNALVEALNLELDRLQDRQQLNPAGVGRDTSFQLNQSIRRDTTLWLDGGTLAQRQLLDAMEQLRLFINQTLFMGLFDFEGHFAVYPPNGFYQKHLDSFRGQSNRMLSVVMYLNREWQPGDGGELVIYRDDDPLPVECVIPQAGRAVIFLSEEIPHEVLATRVSRRSVAGWFRVNNSRPDRIDPAL